MVLLVVDTQKALVNNKIFGLERFVEGVKRLIDTARKNGIEVAYVTHDNGVGSGMTKGDEGFEIYEGFMPMSSEKVFAKNVNSAFRDTGLREYLKDKAENDVIIVGLQTDKCIDATIKCGFEHGFNMIVPAYANSTIDNIHMASEKSYVYYNEYMWNGRYAKCIPLEEAIELMKNAK